MAIGYHRTNPSPSLPFGGLVTWWGYSTYEFDPWTAEVPSDHPFFGYEKFGFQFSRKLNLPFWAWKLLVFFFSNWVRSGIFFFFFEKVTTVVVSWTSNFIFGEMNMEAFLSSFPDYQTWDGCAEDLASSCSTLAGDTSLCGHQKSANVHHRPFEAATCNQNILSKYLRSYIIHVNMELLSGLFHYLFWLEVPIFSIIFSR